VLKVDLRWRKAFVSAGRFPNLGMAGNFPSGESYIVPYEGEKEEISQTQGTLPVQFGDEVVLYQIVKNRAVNVVSTGKFSELEQEAIKKNWAYGNIAELGFGVLEEFGIKILLDEKLGFHIAFGRSDHFGGMIGVKDFSCPEDVVHIDRIYIPSTQPKISVASIVLDEKFLLLEKNKLQV
jgi:hypothetical protein